MVHGRCSRILRRFFRPVFVTSLTALHAAPWLALAKPTPLSDVLDENIGRARRTDLGQLGELEAACDYPLVVMRCCVRRSWKIKRLAVVIAQQLDNGGGEP